MVIVNTKVPIIVPPEGPLTAKIVIVGEAPGTTEIIKRKPFCGSSGDLLNRLLHQVGISRGECYVTNVIKEQPVDNDCSHFISFQRGVKETAAYRTYEQQFLNELSSLNPNVIIALGNVALYALTKRVGITKWRGSILEGPGGTKVIPTIHPAAALRQHLFTHYMLSDLKRVKEESESRGIKLPERNFILHPSFSDCLAFLQKMKEGKKLVAFDIEVVNLEVSCISFCNDPAETICIPFVEDGHDYFTPDQETEIWKEIASLLEDETIPKLGQNIIFDSGFLYRKYGISVRGKDDTMVGQAYIAPELPKGLDFITSIYTREPYYKDDGKKWFKLGGTDYRTFWTYNAKDSAVCLEAFPSIVRDVRRLGNDNAYKRQVRLIEPLLYMMEHGVKVDVEGMRKASEEAEVKITELTDKLQKKAGYALNPASPKQLANHFYTLRGYKPYVNHKTGGISTDEKALKRLVGKGSEEAKLIMEIRKLAKMKGTYYDIKVDDDNRLRCSFNPVGTVSGRLSSSKTIFDTGGNFQNIPPEVKKYLLADPGYIMYNLDLSQAENRCVAYIAPELNMIRAFEEGIDIHRQTASMIFGKPMDAISTDEDVEEDPSRACWIGGGTYSERFFGKKANHGLNYDLGYKQFAMLYEIPENDAKFVVERYHQAYPGIRQYHAWIRQKLSQDRILEDCYGRKRLFLDRWGDELFKEAYSFIPQGSVASKINLEGLLFLYEDQTRFKEVELLNQVHDSIVFQLPYSIGWRRHAEILCALRESLETPILWKTSSFVIPADCKAGPNMHDMQKVAWHKWKTIESLAKFLEETFTAKGD